MVLFSVYSDMMIIQFNMTFLHKIHEYSWFAHQHCLDEVDQWKSSTHQMANSFKDTWKVSAVRV